jgi:hypothetical protein
VFTRERDGLLRGPLRPAEVEREEISGTCGLERARDLGGDGQVDPEAARGLDERRGAVRAGGKEKEEPRQTYFLAAWK